MAYVSALARCVFKVAVDQTFEDVCVYSIERCVRERERGERK